MEVVIPIESDLKEEDFIKKLNNFDKYPIKTEVLYNVESRYLVKIKSDDKTLFYFGKGDKSKIAREIEKYFEECEN